MIRNPESPFIQRMYQGRIMPIFFNPDPDVCLKLLETAYAGGIRVIEMVNRGKEAPDNFPIIRKRADEMEGLSLGIGTIYKPEEAEQFLKMGAEFIVSPIMSKSLGQYCSDQNIPWIPGCGTVTEVYEAQELGAELVKIYPANILTPDFVKAIHAVLPNIEIIPTGGVEPTSESIKTWLDAGVCCLGMGSQLMSKNLVAAGEYAMIQNTIESALNFVNLHRAD